MTPDQLRAWRWEHHLSQIQLAQQLNVGLRTLKRWESGGGPAPSFLRLALERLDQLLPSKPEPSAAALEEMPEVDNRRARRGYYAGRVASYRRPA